MRWNRRMIAASDVVWRMTELLWQRTLRPLGGRSLDLLLPPGCAWCGGTGVLGEPLFCVDCLRKFTEELPERRRCERCAAPIRAVGAVPLPCPYCSRRHYQFARAWVLGDYRGPLRDAVVQMKQAAREPLTIQMGRLVGQRLSQTGWATGCDLVAALPSHWWRRWSRGTSGPELLADEVARELNLPLVRGLLYCTRPTQKQGTLSPHQRWLNVRGAFALRGKQDVSGRRVLLIDDVLTTGATVNDAARALLAGGAGQVDVAVVARGLGDTGKSS